MVESSFDYTKIIQAVRANKYIGKGSLSYIDECHSDAEIVRFLTEEKITTPKKAITALIWLQDLLWEDELETKANWQDNHQVARNWKQFVDSGYWTPIYDEDGNIINKRED